MTMPGDRLTRLPNALLLKVLSHAPAKEAVRTGALSRPWRSLWLSSGVLNLDSRSYEASRMRDSLSLVFLRDADAALRAIAAVAGDPGSGLRKLTFTYHALDDDESLYWSRRHINDGLAALLTASPAVRVLEELHVRVSPMNHYSLGLASLPSKALRTLHLDGLQLTPPAPAPCSPPAASFAQLETLRVYRCDARLTDLQAIVDASPLLAVLELDHVHLSSVGATGSPSSGTAGTWHQRLRCPQITAISLANLRRWYYRLELHAPSLRRFAYSRRDGEVVNMSLEQPGGLRREEQIRELNLRIMMDAVLLLTL